MSAFPSDPSAKKIDPRDVARLLADEVDPSRPVVLLGFGDNARCLAELLIPRGVQVSARDDSLAEPMIEEIAGAYITVWPAGTPMHAQAQYICTLLDDAELIERLPVCLDLARWSDVYLDLLAHILAALTLSWPIPERARREAA